MRSHRRVHAMIPIVAMSMSAVLLLSAEVRATLAWDCVLSVTTDYSVSGQVSSVDVVPPWSVDAGVILVPNGYVMPVVTEITSSRDPADPHFQDPMRYIAGLEIPELPARIEQSLGRSRHLEPDVVKVHVLRDIPAHGGFFRLRVMVTEHRVQASFV